uniref:Uncharacterized protein n=1 Tax=Oryza nivara TaxID=4536 RepID=A0A0E0IG16_ORYNI
MRLFRCGASSSSRRAQGCGGIRPLKRRLVDLGFHLKSQLKKTRGVSQHAKKRNIGDDHADDIEQPPLKRSRAKQESSRASSMKLIKLYPHMSGEQKRLIEGGWLPWPRRSQVLEAQT